MISTITDDEIERARVVLDNHTVDPLAREGALESGLFCIASQGEPWEIPSKFVYALRKKAHPGDPEFRRRYTTIDVLTNADLVNAMAREAGWRFHHKNRFAPFIEYFGQKAGEWWTDVRDADYEARRSIIKGIKWISNKTLDFWMLCLGRSSIALDVHVMKGLHALGVDVNPTFYTPVARSNGSQRVRRTPNSAEYAAMEGGARTLFAQDERFVKENGQVDMALVDTILWWGGANRGDPDQGYLFGGDRSGLILPYAGPIRPA